MVKSFFPVPFQQISIVDLSERAQSPGSGEVARIRGGLTILEMPEKCEDVSIRILTNHDRAGCVACITAARRSTGAAKSTTGA
jgi:hypothetical protein